MPTITADIETRVDVDVEVYCNTCGCGLCGETSVDGHKYPQLKVNVCPDCMKEKDREIDDLNSEIKDLKQQIFDLERELSSFQ